MGESVHLLRGVFRGGVVIPDIGCELPDGTAVTFEQIEPLPPELVEEMEAWERLGDEAWAQIDWGEGEIARDAG